MNPHNLLISLMNKSVYVLKIVAKMKINKIIYGHNRTMKSCAYKVLINVQKENTLNKTIH